MSVNVGDKFKDFTLYDSTKQKQTLSDFTAKGVTILAFFPGAFTGACDKEACSLRDSMSRLNDLGASVVGVAVDSAFALKEFSNRYELNFPLLSDFERAVTNDYGVLFNGLGGIEGYTVANRAIFIIDKAGIVRYKWTASPNPGVLPDYDELIKTVESLKS